jgi:multicomponent Na+:H+ antiporter subunit E
LPRSYTTLSASKDWLRLLWETLTVIPRAYREAIEMMIRPHTREDVVKRRIKPERTPGLIFLDIFLITLTPKTLVMKYHEEGWYEVHRVRRKMKP